MSWHAKPIGVYADVAQAVPDYSVEAIDNIKEITKLYKASGYTNEAIAGILANVAGESGFNPWVWESQYTGSIDQGKGYGLYQFTSAYDYVNPASSFYSAVSVLNGYGPNMSLSQSIGNIKDGEAQTMAVIRDILRKWTVYVWRDYWNISSYPSYRQRCLDIRSRWGNGSTLTQDQYRQITDVDDATFAWLACYEGPGAPTGYDRRVVHARYILTIVESVHTIPIWLLFKMKEANDALL